MATRIETQDGWVDVSSGLMNELTGESIETGREPAVLLAERILPDSHTVVESAEEPEESEESEE